MSENPFDEPRQERQETPLPTNPFGEEEPTYRPQSGIEINTFEHERVDEEELYESELGLISDGEEESIDNKKFAETVRESIELLRRDYSLVTELDFSHQDFLRLIVLYKRGQIKIRRRKQENILDMALIVLSDLKDITFSIDERRNGKQLDEGDIEKPLVNDDVVMNTNSEGSESEIIDVISAVNEVKKEIIFVLDVLMKQDRITSEEYSLTTSQLTHNQLLEIVRQFSSTSSTPQGIALKVLSKLRIIVSPLNKTNSAPQPRTFASNIVRGGTTKRKKARVNNY